MVRTTVSTLWLGNTGKLLGGRARGAGLMRQQYTLELMRLSTCIDNPQSNRPLSRHAHFGRSKAKILCHDVDRLLRRITAHCPQDEQGDETREGK